MKACESPMFTTRVLLTVLGGLAVMSAEGRQGAIALLVDVCRRVWGVAVAAAAQDTLTAFYMEGDSAKAITCGLRFLESLDAEAGMYVHAGGDNPQRLVRNANAFVFNRYGVDLKPLFPDVFQSHYVLEDIECSEGSDGLPWEEGYRMGIRGTDLQVVKDGGWFVVLAMNDLYDWVEVDRFEKEADLLHDEEVERMTLRSRELKLLD